MTHHALFVIGEGMLIVSILAFIYAGIEAICHRARK